MAQDSIVGGLFGLTPEMYQRSQQAADQQEAMQFAQLSPFQQASAGFYSAGRGLGRGIGSMLGAEDPQLRMIAQQQQILRNIDPNDPESLAQGARMASEMGNARLAAALAEQQRKVLESASLVAQRVASTTREKQTAIPTNIQEAQYVATLRNNRNQIAALPDSEEKTAALANIDAQLAQLIKIEKPMTFGAERESIAFELYGKRVSDLNQNQIAEVNRRAEASATGRAKASATQVLVPGIKEVKDLPKLRKDIQDTVKQDLDVIRATQQSLEQLDISIKQNNPISFNAARVQLARAIGGGGDLAIKEIQSAGGDPSIVGKLLDTGSTLFTGTPTVELQNQIKTTLNALKTVATNRANNELQTQRDLAVASGFKKPDIDKIFKFKELETVIPQNLNPIDAAAAELEKRRSQPK
jgi:hypothetical protein